MPIPDNMKVNLLLVITALIFCIFATGKATPAAGVPTLIVGPP